MNLVCVFIISLLLSWGLSAQSQPERFEKARQHLAANETAVAIAELRTIALADKASFETNNLDYLLARLNQRTGNGAEAAAYFQSVRARRSILRQYATWHLAELARVSGNLLMERAFLLELLADRPDSLLADAARKRIAQSHFESKNYEVVLTSVSAAPGTSSATLPRELSLLRGRSFLYKGDAKNAAAQFESVIASTVNPGQPDDLALEAVRGIDLLDVGSERFGKEAAKLSDYEHLKRAQIYQFNRDFAAARLHFLRIVNDHPSSGIAPDAMFQTGRGYTQSANFSEAVKWYERVSEQHPDHPVNKDAALQLASSYARLERYREAVARYERFIQNYPEDERLDRAYLNIVDVLRDAGEETEALQKAQKTQEVFKGKPAEAQGLFSQVRIRLARSDWQNALADLEKLATLKELGGTTVPGGTTKIEVAFLRAFVLEQLRRFPESVYAYLAIPDGRNEYHGWRATERLRELAVKPDSLTAVEEKRKALESGLASASLDARRLGLQSLIRLSHNETERTRHLQELQKLYSTIPAYKIPALPKTASVGRTQFRTEQVKPSDRGPKALADELMFLGLFDEAAPEYELSVRGVNEPKGRKLSPELEYTVADLYLKGGRADRAAQFIEQVAKPPSDFQPELFAGEVAGMLYPVPYRDSLTQFASPRKVDPRFLLSIMKQESAFRPNVKSVAAARGLMQFISDTSNRIADELGRENFDQNELYHPPTAVLFGSQYIGNLFKMFPNQSDAVAASYNGGEDNMQRWYNRSHSTQPERYVPEIAFAQSKDYAWRVMANYRMYQQLYDENLNRK